MRRSTGPRGTPLRTRPLLGVQMGTRRSGRQLPRAHAGLHCSGCRWGRAEVDGSCPEHTLGCSIRSSHLWRWHEDGPAP